MQTTPVKETVNLEEDARKADLLVLKDEVTNKIKKLEHLTDAPTPFGAPGKVYDRGSGGNHLDVYVR